jgi:hypothetical protein
MEWNYKYNVKDFDDWNYKYDMRDYVHKKMEDRYEKYLLED